MSEWQRPKGCSANECIEVRRGLEYVEIRSGRHRGADPYGLALATIPEWAAFVAAVKAGEYDAPS